MSNRKTDRSSIVLGTILVCLGILFLLNTFNLLSWRTWNIIIRFWPVILIIIGLNIILKRSRLWWLVPLLIIILFLGLIFGFPRSMQPFNHFSDKEYSGNYSYSRDIEEDLDNLRVNINYKAGKFILKHTDDERKLCNLDLMYTDSKPSLEYDYQKNSRGAQLSIGQNNKVRFNKTANNNVWDIKLSKKIPLFITLNAGAGKIDLDLSKLKVNELNVNSGVSDLRIDFNNYSTESVINSGASNIKLYIPSRVAVKITTSAVINNNNFQEAGLIKLSSKLYQSENIGEAENRININISTSASNIQLFYR